MAERNETLYNNAERFAEAFYGLAKDGKVAGLTPYDRDLLRQGEDAFIDFYTDAFLKKLDTDYPENGWDDKKADRLNETKPQEGVSYVLYGGDSPEKKHDAAEFTKFHELVKDGKWYDMTAGQLSHWASTKGGYDWSSKGDRDKFWEDLSRFDLEYNRAKNVDEFANSGWGKYAAVMSPTAYKEAMEQALTDKPYSASDVWTAHGIDQVRAALTGGAMGLQGVVRPAIGMGLADAFSQYADAAALGHRDFSPEEMLSAASAGATIVPGFRFATRWLSRAKSPTAQGIGREMYRGARNYQERDAVAEEANALKEQLLRTRKEQSSMTGMIPGTPEYDAAAERLTDMEDKLRLLGFNGRNFSEADFNKYMDEMSANSFNNAAPGRFISIDQMLGRGPSPVSDASASRALEGAINDKSAFNVNRPTLEEAAVRLAGRNLGYTGEEMDAYSLGKMLRGKFGIETFVPGKGMESAVEREAQKLIENGEAANYLDQVLRGATERRAALKGTFPAASAKFAGETKKQGKTGWSRTGAYAANTLGLLSGAKGIDLVNTVRGAGSVSSGNSVFQDKIDAFKQSDWYRNLPEDRKNAIDYAFKKAAEERKKKGK